MAVRNGRELLTAWIPAEEAEAFKAQARSQEGGTSAALRRLVLQSIDAKPTLPRGAGKGTQVSVRLKQAEREALTDAAKSYGTSPANWLRSLAITHLAKQPQWNPDELEHLRDLFRELRAIGNNVNQIAHGVNIAVQSGQYPPRQGDAAREAAEAVRAEMRRVVGLMSKNLEYWGVSRDAGKTVGPSPSKPGEVD